MAGQRFAVTVCVLLRRGDQWLLSVRAPGVAYAPGSIGLIGSAGKWARFQRMLAEGGHDRSTIARIRTPIGLAEITGKEPATIAVSVAADLLLTFERERSAARS